MTNGSMHRAFSETRILAEKAQAEKAVRRPSRGPERFFYDTSTYTGAHAGKPGPSNEPVDVPVPEPEKLAVLTLHCPMCETKFKSGKAHPKCPNCLSSVPRCEETIKAQLVAAGRAAVEPWRKVASAVRRPSSECSTRAPSVEAVSRVSSKEHAHFVEQVRALNWWERGGDRESVLRGMAVTESEKIPHFRKPSIKPALPSMPKLRPL